MNLLDFRVISNGYDPSLVEAVGGEAIYQCINEGANLQAINIKTSALAKDAKQAMKDAKKLANTDPKSAARKYDSAISKLKELKTECEKIEDDHLAMVFVDSFIKTLIPLIAGYIVSRLSFAGTLVYITSVLGGYVCGMSKTLDYLAAIEKGMTQINKAGPGDKMDASIWWKSGQTRGATMVKFDRMITACEKAKEQLGK